ncbi:MAG: copper amine oxidase N-terminal domain-containing protein [Defluviitaleaceae bacterium]|nr:copper amine oxidase N-terminal domain-containing protein [Defluviitaleaceae bacterium]
MKPLFLPKYAVFLLILIFLVALHIKTQPENASATVSVSKLAFSSFQDLIHAHMTANNGEYPTDEEALVAMTALDFAALDTIHLLTNLPFQLVDITLSENFITYLYMPRIPADNQFLSITTARQTHEILELIDPLGLFEYADLYEINLHNQDNISAWSAGDFSAPRENWAIKPLDRLLDIATPSPSPTAVIIDNKPILFQAYNIEGRTFFSIQDIEYMLDGTPLSQSVSWTGGANITFIATTAYHYLISDSAEAPNSHSLIAAMIVTDGLDRDLAALNIDGQNYFMLRHLANILGFSVNWDNNTRTILITTTKD